MATGEPPFRGRQFDRSLVCGVMGGLRPPMPDLAPEEYKKLAQLCCDADPNKRPDAGEPYLSIHHHIKKAYKDNSDDNVWNAIHYNDVRPLSSLEERKYSSRLLPTGDLLLPKPRNNYNSVAGMKKKNRYMHIKIIVNLNINIIPLFYNLVTQDL